MTLIDGSERGLECIYEPGEALNLWVMHARYRDARFTLDGADAETTVYLRDEEPGQGFRVKMPDGRRSLEVRVPGASPWVLPVRSSEALTEQERQRRKQFDTEALAVERRLMAGEIAALEDSDRVFHKGLEQGLWDDAMRLGIATGWYTHTRLDRPDLARARFEELRPRALRDPKFSAAISIYLGDVVRREGREGEAAIMFREAARHAIRIDDRGLQRDALGRYTFVLAALGYDDAALHWSSSLVELMRAASDRHADLAITLVLVANVHRRLHAAKGAIDPRPLLEEALAMYQPGGVIENPSNSGPALMGLAALDLQQGKPADALRRIHAARAIPKLMLEVVNQAALADLEVRALLASGADAVRLDAALRTLDELAEGSVSRENWWAAKVRRGEVLAARGDWSGALAAFAGSEDELDALIPLAALGANGQVSDLRHLDGRRQLLLLLLDKGQPEQAMCVARRAHARLSQLDSAYGRWDLDDSEDAERKFAQYVEARTDYEQLLQSRSDLPEGELQRATQEAKRRHDELQQNVLELFSQRAANPRRPACEALSPREPGELLLGLHPLGDDLLVIASADGGTTHHIVRGFGRDGRGWTPKRLSAELFRGLDHDIDGAKRIRVLATHGATTIDVHALSWRGRPLIRQRPVVYGLELLAPRDAVDGAGPSSALVVADGTVVPAGEVDFVVGRIAETGTKVVQLGSDRQTPELLRTHLAAVEHFHYLGHAYRSGTAPSAERGGEPMLAAESLWPPYPGGAASEPAFIPLDGDAGRLEVADILMLEQVPRTVMLMGCATGSVEGTAPGGGVSLAAAFLGAGSVAVVASTRKVGSAEAFLLGRELAEHLGHGAAADPGRWMQHALEAALEGDLEPSAIADYRVFVP